MAFPEDVERLLPAKDIEDNGIDVGKIQQYEQKLLEGDFEEAKRILLNEIPDGPQKMINANRYNQVLDTVEQIEEFMNNSDSNYKKYINQQITRYKDVGLWDSSVNYTIDNVVSYNGNLYIAIQDNISQIPVGGPDDTYWAYFVRNQKQYITSPSAPTQIQVGDIWFQEV